MLPRFRIRAVNVSDSSRAWANLQAGPGVTLAQQHQGQPMPVVIARGADEERHVVAADQRLMCPLWAAIKLRVWFAAMVLRTARPTAPLICWETLVIPDAKPRIGGGHVGHRDRQQRHEGGADPEPDREAGQEHGREEGGVGHRPC